MWNRFYGSAARHFLRFYIYYSVGGMGVSLVFCIFMGAPDLNFLVRVEEGYGHVRGWADFAFVIVVLSSPALYMVMGLMLAWTDKLRPARAFRNIVAGAAITILSHAIVYNKSYFLITDSDKPLEAKLEFYNSLYFSIVTFTTLGYGDFTPDPPYRLIAALQGIYGYIFLGTLVGMMANFDSSPRRGSKQKSAQTADNGGERRDDP